MGVALAYTIPEVLNMTGMNLEEIDFSEIYEEFANRPSKACSIRVLERR
jgi:hypothetical protein